MNTPPPEKETGTLFNQFRLRKENKTKTTNYPVENKFIQRVGNQLFKVGLCSMQGRRESMEDAHLAVVEMENHKGVGMFAVFDGHDGWETSWFCAENIGKKLDACKEFTVDEITEKFVELDDELGNKNSGSTCTLVIVDSKKKTDKGVHLTVVNLGDSRSIVGSYDSNAIRVLTSDHKPELPVETARIEAAGGNVFRNRVDSSLAVSRAFGDKQYKSNPNLPKDKQKVICIPDVKEDYLAPNEFLFICCDGIFETYSNETAVQFVSSQLKDNKDLGGILSNLLTSTLKGGSRDNMTAMIIELADGSDYTKPEEFIPGKLYAYGNETFFSSYRFNCEQHGLKWEEIEKNLPKSEELESADMRPLSSRSSPSLVTEKNPIALISKSTRTTQSSRHLMAKMPMEISHKLEDSKEEDNIEKAEPKHVEKQHETHDNAKKKKLPRSASGKEKKGIIAMVTSMTNSKKK